MSVIVAIHSFLLVNSPKSIRRALWRSDSECAGDVDVHKAFGEDSRNPYSDSLLSYSAGKRRVLPIKSQTFTADSIRGRKTRILNSKKFRL